MSTLGDDTGMDTSSQADVGSETSSISGESEVDQSSTRQPTLLSRDVIKKGLSQLQRVKDGTQFALTRLELPGMGLTTLEGDLPQYSHLRYINVQHNDLTSLSPLNKIPSVLSIQAQHNQINSLDGLKDTCKNLQILQLDHNQLEFMYPTLLNIPNLFACTLSKNKMTKIKDPHTSSRGDDRIHKHLNILDLSFNSLTGLEGIRHFPELRVLNLRSNSLENLDGIQHCKQLEKLDVGDNRLSSLMNELNRLSSLTKLTHLIISGNPTIQEEIEQLYTQAQTTASNSSDVKEDGTMVSMTVASSVEEHFLMEVLLILPTLEYLDGRKIKATERKLMDTMKKERLEEAQRRKLLLEEEKKREKEEEAERKRLEREENGLDPLQDEEDEDGSLQHDRSRDNLHHDEDDDADDQHLQDEDASEHHEEDDEEDM